MEDKKRNLPDLKGIKSVRDKFITLRELSHENNEKFCEYISSKSKNVINKLNDFKKEHLSKERIDSAKNKALKVGNKVFAVGATVVCTALMVANAYSAGAQANKQIDNYYGSNEPTTIVSESDRRVDSFEDFLSVLGENGLDINADDCLEISKAITQKCKVKLKEDVDREYELPEPERTPISLVIDRKELGYPENNELEITKDGLNYTISSELFKEIEEEEKELKQNDDPEIG